MFSGSYLEPGYGTEDRYDAPWDLRNNRNRIVNNNDGSIVGYKYFNFDRTKGKKDLKLLLELVPEGIDGTITVWADRPWAAQGGKRIGSVTISADMPQASTEICLSVPSLAEMTGKHAIFFTFTSDEKDKSLCSLESLVFSETCLLKK